MCWISKIRQAFVPHASYSRSVLEKDIKQKLTETMASCWALKPAPCNLHRNSYSVLFYIAWHTFYAKWNHKHIKLGKLWIIQNPKLVKEWQLERRQTHIYEGRSFLSEVLFHIAACRHHNYACKPVSGRKYQTMKARLKRPLSQPFSRDVLSKIICRTRKGQANQQPHNYKMLSSDNWDK